MTSVLEGGAGGCASRFPPSRGTGGHGGHTFPIYILIFKWFSF